MNGRAQTLSLKLREDGQEHWDLDIQSCVCVCYGGGETVKQRIHISENQISGMDTLEIDFQEEPVDEKDDLS